MGTIRFSAKKSVYRDETRYRVEDHAGNVFVDRCEVYRGYRSFNDDEYLEAWRKETSLTPELAMEQHAPLSWDGVILPPDTRIKRITIETLSEEKRSYIFYALRNGLTTFLVNPKDIKFYGFETLNGNEERFLYADIKRICFEEV